MKKRKKGFLCIALTLALTLTSVPVFADSDYVDVPTDSWAVNAINAAKEYDLMSGRDSSHFGYGQPVTKAEFVTILCNMFDWTPVLPATASFADVPGGSWYYSYIETALAHNVMDKTASFAPGAAITRQEVAVMFVRALGLNDAAKLEASAPLPFTDVTNNKGYISVARSIGMISGTSATTFAPTKTATREEVASMLTQVYSKYYGSVDFLHGFYAISSYSQKALTNDMDAVTLVWSTLVRDDKGIGLNTESNGGNQYKIPDSYGDITSYLDDNGTKAHLGVYMDTSGGLSALLADSAQRTEAVQVIMEELTKTYTDIGKNPYRGVTINFEGLKGNDAKQGLNDFLTQLSLQLKALDKTLYVTVQPALSGSAYFDGFDYRTIGNLADKVILMAHNYNPTSLSGSIGTEWYKNAALTPLSQVYYSLKVATDPQTGVADSNKLVLAISFAAVGWQISDDGKLIAGTPVQAGSQAVASLLKQPGTVKGFSQTYQNPYITYKTEDGKNIFLWYENDQSISAKAGLARLLGINGVSLWRLGNIPNEEAYNIMDCFN